MVLCAGCVAQRSRQQEPHLAVYSEIGRRRPDDLLQFPPRVLPLLLLFEESEEVPPRQRIAPIEFGGSVEVGKGLLVAPVLGQDAADVVEDLFDSCANRNGDGLVDPLDSGFVQARFGGCS